jgi:hypothetical protein
VLGPSLLAAFINFLFFFLQSQEKISFLV